MMKRIAYAIAAGGALLLLRATTVNGWLDVPLVTAPANPAAGYGRLYVDSGTTLLGCITSTGATCIGAGSGGGGGAVYRTQTIEAHCDVPRTQTLAGNAFWTVTSLVNYDFGHWELMPGSDGHIYCQAQIPHNLNSSPSAAVILETSSGNTAASKAIRWQVSTRSVSNGGSLDATFTAEAAQNITQPTTANQRTDVTFLLTNQPSADDLLIIDVARLGSSASDTLTTLNGCLFRVLVSASML